MIRSGALDGLAAIDERFPDQFGGSPFIAIAGKEFP